MAVGIWALTDGKKEAGGGGVVVVVEKGDKCPDGGQASLSLVTPYKMWPEYKDPRHRERCGRNKSSERSREGGLKSDKERRMDAMEEARVKEAGK